MKLLALHGFGQNARKMYVQTSSLRKSIKAFGTIEYMDGFHALELKQVFGWWSDVDHVHETVEKLKAYIDEHGPYDGLIGFSQGGSAAFAFGLKYPELVKVIVFVSSRAVVQKERLSEKIRTLHIFGNSDTIVPEVESRALMELCTDGDSIQHDGGHYIPCIASVRKKFVAFLIKEQ